MGDRSLYDENEPLNNDGILNVNYEGGITAIEEFYDAVEKLNNYLEDGLGGITSSALDMARVGEYLVPANRNLASGWYEASNFCKKLDAKLQGILKSLVIEMERYVARMKSTEYAAQNAVNEANKVTNNLLDELNGI